MPVPREFRYASCQTSPQGLSVGREEVPVAVRCHRNPGYARDEQRGVRNIWEEFRIRSRIVLLFVDPHRMRTDSAMALSRASPTNSIDPRKLTPLGRCRCLSVVTDGLAHLFGFLPCAFLQTCCGPTGYDCSEIAAGTRVYRKVIQPDSSSSQ